jgi:hypothetical protein
MTSVKTTVCNTKRASKGLKLDNMATWHRSSLKPALYQISLGLRTAKRISLFPLKTVINHDLTSRLIVSELLHQRQKIDDSRYLANSKHAHLSTCQACRNLEDYLFSPQVGEQIKNLDPRGGAAP